MSDQYCAHRTLVVGSSGQLGSALVRQLGELALPAARAPQADNVLRVDLEELAASPASAQPMLAAQAPAAVICAAGATDVERCESDRNWAEAANHTGPLALARATAKVGIPFVFLSTDYVFDGREDDGGAGGPYSEEDIPAPLSVYGATKLAGERAILNVHPRALVIRTTTVYGPDPQAKNFLYTLRRVLGSGGVMRVATDQLSTPTYVEDLATATLTLLRGGHSGIFHVAGPEFVSRYEFALQACEILGLPTDNLVPATTAELAQKAARPLLGGLQIDRLTSTLAQNPMRTPEEGIRAWAAAEGLAEPA